MMLFRYATGQWGNIDIISGLWIKTWLPDTANKGIQDWSVYDNCRKSRAFYREGIERLTVVEFKKNFRVKDLCLDKIGII